MLKTVLLLIFLCSAGHCFPQCYFYSTYDYTGRYDGGFSVVQTLNNDFIVAGSSDEPVGIGDGAYVIKTDECGNILWKSFNILSPARGGENIWKIFENSSANSLIIFGDMFDTSEGKGSGLLFKLNSNGDSLYHKVINHGIGITDFCNTALKNNDNQFILGGYYNVSPPNAKVFLSRVDSLGNIIWKRDYGDTVNGLKLKNVAKALDDGYIMGGWENYGPNGLTQNLYLLKTDSLGHQQWKKRYPATYYQGYVLATSDGGYLLLGNHKPSTSIYYGYVGKMDSAGVVQWQQYFDQSGDPGVLVNAKESYDGNYIVTGDITSPIGDAVAYLAKLSRSDGSVIWERQYSYYGGESHNYIEDIIITTEGDIVGTGYIIPVGVTNNTQNDMFVLKVDSCGYLENPNINASFSFTLDTFSKTVTFNNQSTEYCTSLWYFGDEDSIYARNTTHAFHAFGSYPITLIVRAGNSSDTIQQQIDLVDSCGYMNSRNIDADFSYSIDSFSVDFTNESQNYCSTQWSFGDGATSNLANSVHVYQDTGTYRVTLRIQAGNSEDSIARYVRITHPVGIDPRKLNQGVIVFPNPANNIVHIESTDIPFRELNLFDITGKKLAQQIFYTHSEEALINTRELIKGIYFIEIRFWNGESIVKKIVVE